MGRASFVWSRGKPLSSLLLWTSLRRCVLHPGTGRRRAAAYPSAGGALRGVRAFHMGPGLQQMFFIPAAMCLCLTAAALRSPVGTLESCIWAGLLGSAAFWFGIWLMILIPALQKERSRGLADQQYRQEMQSFLDVIRSQRHDGRHRPLPGYDPPRGSCDRPARRQGGEQRRSETDPEHKRQLSRQGHGPQGRHNVKGGYRHV